MVHFVYIKQVVAALSLLCVCVELTVLRVTYGKQLSVTLKECAVTDCDEESSSGEVAKKTAVTTSVKFGVYNQGNKLNITVCEINSPQTSKKLQRTYSVITDFVTIA
jgi:hypothetical protein